tara:strand:- start:368 stop:718 length:351 start_codon:yes stop_codon:yes gene_type:complete
MRYEVVNERKPEDHTGIFTVKVSRWHSFISGNERTIEYLGLSNDKTKNGDLEIYEAVEQPNKAPVFVRMSEKEQERLWKAILLYRQHKKLREVEDEIGEKYGDWFTEPIKGPQTYR